jgi:hypothetical protein
VVLILSYCLYEAKEKAAHEDFMGSPPVASKPYNILDYTKPAAKP